MELQMQGWGLGEQLRAMSCEATFKGQQEQVTEGVHW